MESVLKQKVSFLSNLWLGTDNSDTVSDFLTLWVSALRDVRG